jgi:SAM-dependent methyltransferase
MAIPTSNTHNLDGMFRIKTQFFMLRFDRLIFSMMANEKFNRNSKILIIGPRSESDILKLNSYGYKNIEAIDLISYSKNIKIMDAHNIEYADNTFDSIFCGWVLPYSSHPQKIADNIVRVIKDGGLVSVGIEYHPNEEINSLDKIKMLFKNNINSVFFNYDADLKEQTEEILYKDTGAGSSQILISFSIKKEKK